MIYAATPCGRPDNLLRIMKTIPDSWGWIICYDDRVEIPDEVKQKATLVKCNNTGPAGIYARNHILDHYDFKDEDWIFQLDDDNIIHPDIEEVFKDITEYSDYAIIAFNQCFWNNDLRLRPCAPPQIGAFDIASYLAHWKYTKHLRYHDMYCHDQLYVLDCYYGGIIMGSNDHDGKEPHEDLTIPPPMGIINKSLSYYNYIDKEDWSHPKYEQYRKAMHEQSQNATKEKTK